MIYQFIDENKDIFGLRWLFRHFNIAPNAYYNYLKNNKAGYHKQKQKIYEEIKASILLTILASIKHCKSFLQSFVSVRKTGLK